MTLWSDQQVWEVVPRAEGGWTCECNGIPVRHSPRKDLMDLYARDPGWRMYLAEQAMCADAAALERGQ